MKILEEITKRSGGVKLREDNILISFMPDIGHLNVILL